MRADDLREAAAMLKAAAEDVLMRRPVAKRINSSKAAKDDPTLTEECSWLPKRSTGPRTD